MKLRTQIVSKVIFPLQELAKGHATVRVLRDMERSQWYSPEQLLRLRIDRLRALLRHAHQHVPYYRQMFDEHCFDPEAVDDLTAIVRLPLLTKALIRSHQQTLKSTQARRLATFSTGGSSGEPLTFLIGRERISHDVAAKWRATRWWGVDIGDPEIVVWGSPIELKAQDRLRGLRDWILRTRLLPAFDMSEVTLDAYISEIRRARPAMLFGYPSAIALIAERARANGVPMDDLGIRVAFVTAERLYDEQRDNIATVFGCDVANGYGGRDAGFIAHECPQGSMHVTAEDLLIEIIDPEGRPAPPGTSGEIVVTHFATSDYPFIRYRTGDIGVLDHRMCACGRTLPLLHSIEGRTTDFVVAADGVTRLHGLSLIYVVREQRSVQSFRIVQETLQRTRVQVVPGPGFGEAEKVSIREGIQRRLGMGVDVLIEVVEAIPPERSGKFRYVVSQVKP